MTDALVLTKNQSLTEELLELKLTALEQRIVIKLGGLMVILFGIAVTLIKFGG